jgi:hypothetical protein
MAIVVRGEARCDGFMCEDHDECIKKYAERDRLLDLFDDLYPPENKLPIIMHNELKVKFAEQHERIQELESEKILSEPDARIVKFFVELLDNIIELYAIPPERLREIARNSSLHETEAGKITRARHTHTLYKALRDSLHYINKKYFV